MQQSWNVTLLVYTNNYLIFDLCPVLLSACMLHFRETFGNTPWISGIIQKSLTPDGQPYHLYIMVHLEEQVFYSPDS